MLSGIMATTQRIPVAILGATGTVGQKFIRLLEGHPLFRVHELVASPRNRGKRYIDAVQWHETVSMPDSVSGMVLKATDDPLESGVLFSGLDSSVADEAETAYASQGKLVISNAKNHRMDTDVPLVIPEVNSDHLELLRVQKHAGGIITNSNCSTMFLAMVLAPLHRHFGVTDVHVTTLQAISGAGYPGVASMDILGNVVPYIADEEDKLETEAAKILGSLDGQRIVPAGFRVSAQCTRVPVADGHTEMVSLRFENRPDISELKRVLQEFTGPPQEHGLPSAPAHPIHVLEQPDRPQPRSDVYRENGMVTWVGRIRPCPVFDYRMVVLGHNTVRGAAGAAILNAEMAHALGYISRDLTR